MGKENDLGPILVGDFVFDNFMGAVFKSLVVVFFAVDAFKAVKDSLFVVDELGLWLSKSKMGAVGNNSAKRSFGSG